MLTLVVICCTILAVVFGQGLLAFIPLVIYGIVCLVVSLLTDKHLEKKGQAIEKRTRYKTKTYDDGFGKYTVDVKEEEYVLVPISRRNDKK